jgi:hypothetical protein
VGRTNLRRNLKSLSGDLLTELASIGISS